ncbi:MAG: hypothetical protein SGI92_12570 [Bryobacteraceae bacterium]|nr:hypothetical protein [Bryobacteraceae bacterium]
MDPFNDNLKPADPLANAVADAQTLAREQVQAAWQLHLDRVREALEAGWRDSLERIFTERYADVEAKLRESFEAAVADRTREQVDAGLGPAVAGARRETAETLNNLARRLRSAESRDEVRRSLVDAAGEYSARSVFYEPGELDLQAAPALANALESRDTVVAAATPAELSDRVFEQLGAAPESLVYLVPLVAHDKSLGVLCCLPSGEPVNVSALELLGTLAAPHLELPPEPVIIEPPPPKPGWSDLSRPEQEMHLRAQRFARTRVAELVLNHISRVRDARLSQNLYSTFQTEIDAARQEFRREFFEPCSSMVDYLHLELVRTLAREDADALGADYPGPVA